MKTCHLEKTTFLAGADYGVPAAKFPLWCFVFPFYYATLIDKNGIGFYIEIV